MFKNGYEKIKKERKMAKAQPKSGGGKSRETPKKKGK